MANQPKKYKKFVATAATATLVASAIVPVASAATPKFADVGSDYADAVNAIADLGIVKGYTDGTFKPLNTVDRAGVVKFLGKFLVAQGKTLPSYEDASKVFPFNDLTASTDKELVQYAALVKAEGVFTGYTDGSLKPTEEISRQQMASTLVKAIKTIYGVDLIADAKAANFSSDITDIAGNYYADAISALDFAGITVATKFNPEGTLNRGQFANFLSRSIDYVAGLETTVTSVSAINETTLQVTGTGLKLLKAENLTVDGNKVVSVSSTDGKTATITLDSKLAPNKEVVLKVKDGETTTEFKTTFVYKVTSVQLTEATFDNDLAGQKLAFKVNGQAADADYLALAGYTVNLVAVQKTTGAATPLFVTGTSSSTGELAAALLAGEDYEVEVQLIKSGEALVSGKGTIKVRNIEASTSAINSVKFALDNTAGTLTYDNTGSVPFTDTDFVLNSTKVVAGEAFYVNQANVTVAGEESIAPQANVKVKSSNPAIISVNSSTGLLTAESAGTATVTVTVGDTTKDYTFTVTNEARKLTTVTASPTSVKVIKGKSTAVTFKTLDQYGDPFAVSAGAASIAAPAVGLDEVIPTVSGTSIVTTASADIDTDTVDSIGVVTLNLTGAIAGKGTVYFKDKASKVLGSVYVEVTEVDNVASQKLNILTGSGRSTDTTLDVQADNIVRFELANYNSEGVYAGAQDLGTGTPSVVGPYTIEVADKTIAYPTTVATKTAQDTATATGAQLATVSAAAGETYFELVGLKAGTTDVLLKAANGTVIEKKTITVVNNPIKINSVAWKTVPTIDYVGKVVTVDDVLNLTSTVVTSDNIVNGLTLSGTTPHKVRLAEVASSNTNGATDGDLYLDTDGSGDYTTGEQVLGRVTVNVATGATGVTVSDIFTGTNATAATYKGTVIFKVVTDPTDVTSSISATSVTIDVK